MEARLPLDARKRVTLARFLRNLDVHAVRAYTQDDKIILEPLSEIPTRELWLHTNPEALKAVLEGLEQSKKGKVGPVDIDFSEFADEEI